MSQKKGILSQGGSQQCHVKIIAEEKKTPKEPESPPPSPAAVCQFYLFEHFFFAKLLLH